MTPVLARPRIAVGPFADVTRREFVTGGLAAGLLLVACGSDDAPRSEPSQLTTRRMFPTPVGEVEIPTSPQRVVTVNVFGLDAAISVGVVPVGTVSAFGGLEKTVPSELVGTPGAPSLEKIAALRPDLILALADPEQYPNLARIAPTVTVAFRHSGHWKEILATFADAMGKATEGEAALARYRARAAEVRQGLAAGAAQTTVSVVRVYADKLTAYNKVGFPGAVLSDVGLPRPASQDQDDFPRFGIQQDLSLERLADADAKVILFTGMGLGSDAGNFGTQRNLFGQIKANPLWAQLEAVQAGRAFEVGDHWLGSGLVAANACLDDLFRLLLGRR